MTLPPLPAVLLGCILCAFAAAAEPGPPGLERWRAHAAALRSDPALVRQYLFDEGAGFQVANSAGDGRKGTLTLVSNSPYGVSRQKWWWIWNSPLYQTFPSWTEGRWPGKAALASGTAGQNVVRSQFSGTDDGVFTCTAWLRMHGGGTDGGAPLLNIGDGYGSGWKVAYNRAKWAPQGAIEFRMGSPGGPGIVSGGPFPAKIWHHLACQWDGRTLRLFIDGAPVAEKAFAGPYVAVARNEAWSQHLEIFDVGGLHIGGPGERFDLDEIEIFSRALSADEVRAHAEAGRPAAVAEEQAAAFDRQQAHRRSLDAITMTIPDGTLGIFRRGEKIPATIRIAPGAGWQGAFTGHFLLRGIDNATVLEETRPLVAGSAGATAAIEFAPPRCGVFFLDLWVTDAAGAVVKRLREEYGIAITVPLPPASEIPASAPLQAHNIVGGFPENRFLGFAFDRTIKGSEAYKKPGEIDPRMFEKEMGFARASGLKVMFCLHTGMPAWAERAPGKKMLPKDMSVWTDYCRLMVRQYRDLVAVWEIENEPNAGDLVPPEEYAELVKAAYQAIKAEDPGAIVAGIAGCPGFLNYNEKVFEAGGAKWFDVLTLHNYLDYPIAARNRDHSVRRAIEQVRKWRGEDVPVWNGESGFHPLARLRGRPMTEDVVVRQYPGAQVVPGKPVIVPADMPTLIERDAAALQVQAILLDLGEGCRKYIMLSGVSTYTPTNNDCNGQPSEMAPAIAALQSLLIPSAKVEALPLSSAADAGAIITLKDGRRVAAVFSDEEPTLSFTVGDRAVMAGMDLMGNPLEWKVAPGGILAVKAGRQPVYILDVPAGFAQLQFLRVENASALLADDGTLAGELVVTNPTARPLDATLTAVPPAPRTALTLGAERVALAPGASTRVRFALAGRALGRRAYDLGFVLAGPDGQLAKLSHPFRSEGAVRAMPEAAAGARIGDGAWWKGIDPELCDDEVKVVHGRPVVGAPWLPQWRGAKDQSFTLRTAWAHDDAILMRVEVADDAVMPATPAQRKLAFLYDCIEIFLDARPAAQRSAVVSPGIEQMLVIPNAAVEGGACDFWFGRSGGKTPSLAAEFVGGRTAQGYWIEGRIRPAEGSPLRIRAGTQIAFDVMADDTDREKELRKGVMALHGVFNNNGEPDKWGRYQLDAGRAP